MRKRDSELDGDALAERISLKAIVEACLILEEGVAAMRDIDLGASAGVGIVPAPFARADAIGLDQVLARLERAASEWGEAFEPPMILRRFVAQGRLGVQAGQGFYAYPRPDAGQEDRPVKLETRGPVAIAWLDRPPANSISPEVVTALREIWEGICGSAPDPDGSAPDPDGSDGSGSDGSGSGPGSVRALILASANPLLFCAGADIKAFTRMDAAAARRLVDDMHALARDFERSSVVTIAAVGGLALGGGSELAMACDVRIASESASFGQPEITLGIIPGFGGTQRLARLVGTSKALEMNLTGEPVSGEEAYELGLANRLVPDHELFDTALAWGRALATRAPLAVQAIKQVSGHGDLDAGIEAEKRAFVEIFATADAKEGIAAFVEKRAPTFRGR